MGYRIGIDAGSKTIKLVVIDEAGAIVCSAYERHRAAVKQALAAVVHDIAWRYGDLCGPVAVTGSAGIALAKMLGLPFVQEVVATTKAVRAACPDADAFIELGGEDAKVVYLTGRREQRMNATCAGGTGGFIDTIAFMLGVKSEQMSSLAKGATREYPIASRCAVFAQTDVRPLLNAGAKATDIAASALRAVVRQTLGGLACGRPIRGKVVFLGGPLEHNDELVRLFREALGLGRDDGVKPEDAHLFTAVGCAVAAGERHAPEMSLKVLERRLAACPAADDDLDRLPPLLGSDAERAAFDERHARCKMPRCSIYDYEGEAYLGLDAGSTTVKLALVSPGGKLVYSDYQPVRGDSLKTATDMLGELYRAIPKHYGTKRPAITIARSCVTGYGEDLLKAALRIDGGVVETSAHVRAALEIDPEASFVLDIGGQDMKALWIEDGAVSDMVLNEACSSGCGSFLEGSAYSLHTRPVPFSQAALTARRPVDLGAKCTVFMTSRVRHAQKAGAEQGDIAAGIAYSVVRNVLERIIGSGKVASMGAHIIVQGGAFKSDAVLRAFEQACGVEVQRPDTAHLMGAIGAALIARDEALAADAGDEGAASALLGPEELASMSCSSSTETCAGCANACQLTVVEFSDGRRFTGGGRCSAARVAGEDAPHAERRAPNAVAAQQALMARYSSQASGDELLGHVKVGIVDALLAYEQLPFWHTLALGLGFSVEVADRALCESLRTKAAESIPSESVCQAAKLAHERLYALQAAGASAAVMPRFARRGSCIVASEYADVLARNVGFAADGSCPLVAPLLGSQTVGGICASPEDRRALLEAFESLCDDGGQKAAVRARFDAAIAAAADEQRAFEEHVAAAARSALRWVEQGEGRHALVFGGRPYHADPELLHGIDKVASDLGAAAIPALGLGLGQLERCEDEHSGDVAADCGGSSRMRGWRHAARCERLAQAVEGSPALELVGLECFGCAYDGVSMALLRDELLETGKTCTLLKLDDIADLAHVRIRLRTLVESLDRRKTAGRGPALVQTRDNMSRDMVAEGQPAVDSEMPPSGHASSPAFKPARGFLPIRADWVVGVARPEDFGRGSKRAAALIAEATASAQALLAPGALPEQAPLPPGVSREENGRGVDALGDGGLAAADVARARSSMPTDVCLTARVLAARCANLHAELGGSTLPMTLPRVCRDCVLAGVPALASSAASAGVTIEWTAPAEHDPWATLRGDSLPVPAPAPQPGEPLRVGILGNALLCFEPALNEDVVRLVEACGCTPLLPDAALLDDDDVSFKRQLRRFEEQHAELVLYLQSFACLKSHVQLRGAMRRLAEQHPSLPVSVIEYDPESSALNRENRIRLAIEAAWERRPDARPQATEHHGAYSWLGARGDGVDAAARKLACGADPLAGGDDLALAYLLEEGCLKGETFGSQGDLQACLEERCAAAEEALARQQRELELLRRALRCLR